MNTAIMKKIMLFALSLLIGMLISIDWSPQNGISLGINPAYARIGRPLTPFSVAGVHRRHVRRSYRYGNYYGHAYHGHGYYGHTYYGHRYYGHPYYGNRYYGHTYYRHPYYY